MSKYLDIVNYLLNEIGNRKLKMSAQLPSARTLAQKFACTTATAVRAYAELQKKHIVYAIPKKGYFLVKQQQDEGNKQEFFINFASASPDDTVLPYEDFQHCINEAVLIYQHTLFNYAHPQGLPNLTAALAKHLQDYQVHTDRQNIFVTAGAQQALALLCRMPFPNNGEQIAIEQPAYNGMNHILRACGFPAIGIRRNFSGLDLEQLEKTFAAGNVKFFYTVSRMHNPLGGSYSENEKKAIVKLAAKYHVYLIEDDYLADLDVKSNSFPLYYYDTDSRVIYLKSFSKTLLPGLRVAAAVVPSSLQATFTEYKKWADLGTGVLSQGALEVYLKSGMFQANKKKISELYRQKMQAVREAVSSAVVPSLAWHVPDAGFFVSLEHQGNMNIPHLQQALTAKNILFAPLTDNFLKPCVSANILKVSISTVPLNRIQEGIIAISGEIRKYRQNGF